jgi:hypothetical protein
MTFRIFASGTGNFHYMRESADEGDVYDFGSAMQQLQSLPGSTARDIAVGQATDAVTPDSPLQQGLSAIGSNIAVEQLSYAATMLAVRMAPVDITVSARNPGVFVDTARTAQVYLDHHVSYPAEHFLRRVSPVLEAVGLNRFMVLFQLAEALAGYSRIGRQNRNILLIQLTDT